MTVDLRSIAKALVAAGAPFLVLLGINVEMVDSGILIHIPESAEAWTAIGVSVAQGLGVWRVPNKV